MARITVGKGHGFDMTSLDFGRLQNGTNYVATDSIYGIYYEGGAVEKFRGHDFVYDENELPVGGLVTDYSAADSLGRIVAIDRVHVSVQLIMEAAGTSGRADDYAVIRHELRGDDRFIGGSLDDVALGFRGSDLLKGHGGDDTLTGGEGRDTLAGGDCADILRGGRGADTFLLVFARDSTAEEQDTIMDFSKRQHDRIDLTAIDASGRLPGHAHFDYIGEADFSGAAGELRVDSRHGVSTAQADVDGDGQPDLVVSVHTVGHGDELTSGVFVG
jgi:hypothetical protein